MTRQDPITTEISELLAEAAEARELAAAFTDGPTVADLLGYALALEAEAVKLEENDSLEFDPMLFRGGPDTAAHAQAPGLK